MEHQTSKVPHPGFLIVLSQNTASFHVYGIFMELYNLSFYSRGSFCAIVVLVRIHRPFLLKNLSHHQGVPSKSVTDISMASLHASIKIIFAETASPFFLWSIIQFLTYSSCFSHLGAHERKDFYSYLLWLNLSFASSILVSSSQSEVSQNAFQLPGFHVFQHNSRLQF